MSLKSMIKNEFKGSGRISIFYYTIGVCFLFFMKICSLKEVILKHIFKSMLMLLNAIQKH